jgi:hypothetical protein
VIGWVETGTVFWRVEEAKMAETLHVVCAGSEVVEVVETLPVCLNCGGGGRVHGAVCPCCEGAGTEEAVELLVAQACCAERRRVLQT